MEYNMRNFTEIHFCSGMEKLIHIFLIQAPLDLFQSSTVACLFFQKERKEKEIKNFQKSHNTEQRHKG